MALTQKDLEILNKYQINTGSDFMPDTLTDEEMTQMETKFSSKVPVQEDKEETNLSIDEKIGDASSKFMTRANKFAEATEKGEQTMAEQIFQTAGAGLSGIGESIAAFVPEPINKIFAKIGENKDVQTVIGEWSKLYQDLEANNPRAARNLAATLETTLGVMGTTEGWGFAKGGVTKIAANAPIIKKAVTKTAEEAIAQTRKAGTAVMDLKNSFRLTPRKMEEILSVPKEKVSSLPINEQKVWYDNQREALKSQVAKTGEQATQELTKKKTVLSESTKKAVSEYEAQIVKLQKDLEVTARDKVIELRPRMIEGMRKQSNTYRSLVDDAMADKKGMIIDKDDIKGFIDNRFADDEIMANAVKQRLGLVERVDPLKAGETVGLEMSKKTTTIGKMYEQAKGLRQEISKSTTRAYTPKDKIIDDTIDVLLSYMKENGVDLTEANQFWARYAPIRNKMIREAKPFIQSGIETKTFAKTLERVAKGTDVNNDIFISEVEEILGQSVTADIRKAVSNISSVEKKKIAIQMQEATEKLDIEMQEEAIKKSLKEGEEKGLEKIKTIEFETNRIARKRQLLKNILKLFIPGVVGAGVISAF
jgi:hypothetical protein